MIQKFTLRFCSFTLRFSISLYDRPVCSAVPLNDSASSELAVRCACLDLRSSYFVPRFLNLPYDRPRSLHWSEVRLSLCCVDLDCPTIVYVCATILKSVLRSPCLSYDRKVSCHDRFVCLSAYVLSFFTVRLPDLHHDRWVYFSIVMFSSTIV